ncbi:MAG: LysM domain-containing protein [Burkholderiales bacterium]
MFDSKSRYFQVATYQLTDLRGRTVEVVATPPPLAQALRGLHVRKEGERYDHLAARYLSNPAGFWRLADMNDAFTADALSELSRVRIPER